MVDVAGIIDIPLGLPDSGAGISGEIWFWIGIIALILIAGIVGIYLIQRFKVYNKKVFVFENIAGQGYQLVFKDRARVVKLGDGGEELLYLLKKKVYRTAYGKKMGTNTYWFAVGQDGYWYNIILGDVDAKMGLLDIEPIDRDMRYMHVAIRKNIEREFASKQSFMEKYGVLVFSGIFFIAIMVFLFLWLDKMAVMQQSVSGTVDIANNVQQANNQILVRLDNILSSSGIKKVG